MTAIRGFKSYVGTKLGRTPNLVGKLTKKEISLLKGSSKEKKHMDGRNLYYLTDEYQEWLKEQMPVGCEEKRVKLGVERLTGQQIFDVRNAINAEAWNGLPEEEKAEWSKKAKTWVPPKGDKGDPCVEQLTYRF